MKPPVENPARPGELPPFDPRIPQVRSDPYPLYARYRSVSPVDLGADGTRYAFRHSDVQAVLTDRRFGRRPCRYAAPAAPAEHRAFYRMLDRTLLFTDPPDHRKVRSLLQKSFTPSAVESFRPRIRDVANTLLDRVAPEGRLDLIADFAYPLPLIVIAEILGFPDEDRLRLRELSAAISRGMDTHTTPEEIARADWATRELTDQLRELVAERRRRRREDLLSVMIEARDAGWDLDGVVATAILLLVAGHETTAHLIGNGVLALLDHPEQLELLRHDPSLLPTAVEELLRYDSPVHIARRWPTDDVETGGHVFPAGEAVCALLGSANRDPDVYTDPDRLDLRRSTGRLVAFGSGIHFCLGASLARLEATIAFDVLLRRLPGLARTADALERLAYVGLRGVRALPLDFDADSSVTGH